jgi:DNA-directed RNA polymerase specialized sigma24 family protein
MHDQHQTTEDDEEGSVTLLLGNLKSGDSAAVPHLWERYFAQLVLLAHSRLRRVSGPGGVEDEEDAALSALESFFQGVKNGRFPRLVDRGDLWQILVTITKRKVYDQVERRDTQKRGGVYRQVADGLDWQCSPGPTPEFLALVADQCRVMLDALTREDPRNIRHLRGIALWKLEGFTNEEIAGRLDCAVRTVANRLDLIRKIWNDEGHPKA